MPMTETLRLGEILQGLPEQVAASRVTAAPDRPETDHHPHWAGVMVQPSGPPTSFCPRHSPIQYPRGASGFRSRAGSCGH